MKNTLETRLGLFVALSLLAAVFILDTLGGLERFQRGYRVSALFNSAQELKIGDRVKMAGVEVGRVEDIVLDEQNNKVRVSMKLNGKTIVRTDSVATVKFTGLMGQNFVSITFGTPGSPKAENGTNLKTEEQHDLSEMIQKLDAVATGVENLTKSFTGDKIDSLMGPLTDFLKANKGPLTAMIANLNSVSRQISEGKGTIGKMIYDETLYTTAMTTVSNLQDAGAEIKTTIAEARKVVDQVNSGNGTVGKMLKDDALYKETTSAMSNAREILQKVNQGQGSVGKLINDEEFYKNAKLTLQKLDKATEGLEDQGPLTVLGVVVGKLF